MIETMRTRLREREERGEERKRERERYVWMRVNPTTQAEEPVR